MIRRALVFLVVLTTGCGDIGAPLRSDLYEYRVTSPGDTTAFTWPRDSMPIRIWSEDTFDFPMHLANAMAAWNDVFLYREFQAVPTDDSLTAHVILRAGLLPPGGVSRAIHHRTVEEVWYVLSGEAKVWRRLGDDEQVITATAGTSLTIPVGTRFQFRTIGDEPFQFIMLTLPPWPGEDEAEFVPGNW